MKNKKRFVLLLRFIFALTVFLFAFQNCRTTKVDPSSGVITTNNGSGTGNGDGYAGLREKYINFDSICESSTQSKARHIIEVDENGKLIQTHKNCYALSEPEVIQNDSLLPHDPHILFKDQLLYESAKINQSLEARYAIVCRGNSIVQSLDLKPLQLNFTPTPGSTPPPPNAIFNYKVVLDISISDSNPMQIQSQISGIVNLGVYDLDTLASIYEPKDIDLVYFIKNIFNHTEVFSNTGQSLAQSTGIQMRTEYHFDINDPRFAKNSLLNILSHTDNTETADFGITLDGKPIMFLNSKCYRHNPLKLNQ